MNESTDRARGGQAHNKNAVSHGHHSRVKALKRHGYDAIDRRTWAGKKANDWKTYAYAVKGKECMFHVAQEIELAAVDLWLLLSLVDVIVEDAHQRGSVLNRRRKELPRIHQQYETISQRFSKRCEALQLQKGAVPTDLARKLMMVQQANGGSR